MADSQTDDGGFGGDGSSPPILFRRRRITIPGGTVAGIELGPDTGPLDILWLHANGFNALTYRHVLAELGPGRRVLAVDMRGHGLTTLPVPAEHPGWHIYADDLLALIAALDAPPRILAGHSMGGTTTLLAAARLPKSIRALMLFEPVILASDLRARAGGKLFWDTPLAQGALRRKPGFASREDAFDAYDGRGAFRTWQDGMLRDYLADGLVEAADGVALACAPDWEAANFAAFAIDDPMSCLQAIQLPTTIFTAAHGSTCALTEDDSTPMIRVHALPGTSHFLPMERPGIVCKALEETLA